MLVVKKIRFRGIRVADVSDWSLSRTRAPLFQKVAFGGSEKVLTSPAY